jgi:hypothetical protein
MSTDAASTDPIPAASEAPVATTFQLTAVNNSSVPGVGYFSAFPPGLTNIASPPQLLMGSVSPPSSLGAPVTMTWSGGAGALNLFAIAGDMKPDSAPRTPVALGDIVAVDWLDGAFTLVPAAGGPSDGIELTFTAAVPGDSRIGLVVGPGAVLVPLMNGYSPMTLIPDLSPAATVVFGTAYQWPAPADSDVSRSQGITFKPTSATTVTAHITVGPENTIVQDS